MRRALIIGPGGLRGAYGGGVVATLCRAFGHGYFDKIYGCSAGVYTGSYATSGQPDQMESFWRECVHAGLLINFSRIVRSRRPILDLAYLNSMLQSERHFLSVKDMLASPTTLEIVITNKDTGQPNYFIPRSEEAFFLQARASSAVPVFHPRVRMDGMSYVDGALSDPIPLEKALADGYDEIVIVCDRPVTDMGRLAGAFLHFYDSHAIHGSVRQFKDRIKRLISLSDTLANRVHIISPSADHAKRGRFDRSYDRLNQLVDLGIHDATTFVESYK